MRLSARRGTQIAVAVALALTGVGATLSPAAADPLPPNMQKFANCPVSDPDVSLCIYIKTDSSQLKLGRFDLASSDPLTLQFGVKFDPDTFMPTSVAPTNGTKVLTASWIEIPGGITGLPWAPWPFTAYVKPDTVALPKINTTALRTGRGPALELDLRAQVDNPFLSAASALGPGCYIGSSSDPISLRLTTGTTAPPPPNTPITGKFNPATGADQPLGGLKFPAIKVVDNAYSAPGAHGCGLDWGGVNAIVNANADLPSAAGKNLAVINTDIYTLDAETLRQAQG